MKGLLASFGRNGQRKLCKADIKAAKDEKEAIVKGIQRRIDLVENPEPLFGHIAALRKNAKEILATADRIEFEYLRDANEKEYLVERRDYLTAEIAALSVLLSAANVRDNPDWIANTFMAMITMQKEKE